MSSDNPLAMREQASSRYDIRDYAGVVRLLAETPRPLLMEAPELGFMLADSARRVGGVADVLELTNAVVSAARDLESHGVLCDALNLQGVLLLESGHGQAAERAWCELVIVASETDNSQYVARASNNLGVAAILSMRLEDAITSFQRSVAAYLRLGYSRGLAQSHQNLGIVFRELDHEYESYAHFQSSLTWAYAADCPDDVARAEEELALLLLYTGKDARAARTTAEQALNRFTELGEPRGVAQAMRVVGVVALALRESDAAESALQTALGIAREKGMRLLEAETLLALACLARFRNSAPDSYKLEEEARRIFNESHAELWGEQVRKRMHALSA